MKLHDALTLIEKSILMQVISLVEKCFPKLAAVVFAAVKLLRKVEVFNLTLQFERMEVTTLVLFIFVSHVK